MFANETTEPSYCKYLVFYIYKKLELQRTYFVPNKKVEQVLWSDV